jgi:DNA modification methylase
MPYDWLYYNLVKNVSKEKTFHACQIPQQLSELLIKSCTMPGDTVLVLFGGSGSEIEVCNILNRHFISAEVDEKYYKMILDRLAKGRIEEKYKLRLHRYEKRNLQAQLALLEEKEEYVT